MARPLRTLAIALLLALPAFGPAMAGAATACAAGSSGAPHAALVVDTGSRTTTYCVALDASSVSGLHLIQLAGRQYGLDYSLGFGGQAVCRLDAVGPDGGDCFADYPAFWGYWHGDGAGAWSWAGSGAGSASIGDGDMDGWVWGTGDSGATHAPPPSLAFDDVCVAAPSPSPQPGGGGSGGGGGGGAGDSGGSGAGSSGGAAGASEEEGSGSGSGSHSDPSGPATVPTTEPPTPSEAPPPSDDPEIVRASPVSARASAADSGGGPPSGALIALAMVAALGVGGWITLRRRAGRGRERR